MIPCTMFLATIRHYLFALIFLALGIYFFTRKSYSEGLLYFVAALAFLFNRMASEPKLATYKKPLVAITWILIVVTGVSFLYMLQEKYL